MATEDRNKLKAVLSRELAEIFDDLDGLFVELEKDPSNHETVNSIFRRVHTLKGSMGLGGYKDLERLAHYWEDLLDDLRSGSLHPSPEILDLMFECLDFVKLAYEGIDHGDEVPKEAFVELEERIKYFLPESVSKENHDKNENLHIAPDSAVDTSFISGTDAAGRAAAIKAADEGKRIYQITLRFDKNCIKTGVDPLAFIRGLGKEGDVLSARAALEDIPDVTGLDPGHLYFDEIMLLFATKMGIDSMGEALSIALDSGFAAAHQFTPAELKAHFGIEADSFWTEEPAAPASAMNGAKDARRSAEDVFNDEIDRAIELVRDNIRSAAACADDFESLDKTMRFFGGIHKNADALGLKHLAHVAGDAEARLRKSGGGCLDSADAAHIEASLDEIRSALLSHVQRAVNAFVDGGRKGGFAVGEALLDLGIVTREILDRTVTLEKDAGTEGAAPSARLERKLAARAYTALKIDSERLDNLVDMVGELVIAQSQVTQDLSLKGLADTRLDKNIAQLTRITGGIQDIVMSMRMLPLEQTFKKMSRVIRDVSKSLGKEVELHVFGEETEVDKTIIDEIGDPLMHMIRNCVDHGIEKPEERLKTGKLPKGRIELSAFHRGGNVVIEIKDDGKGLSRKKIAEKGVSQGLIETPDGLSDQQVFSLIFEPGFSTAEIVTEISGRGVGLDAVKKSVEKLRGKVDVVSDEGKGTTFSIKLPLTLAIIEGMLVKVGQERYIVPTLSIESSFRPSHGDITRIDVRGEVVKVRGELFTLVRLHKVYGIASEKTDPAEAILILVESEGRRCCIMVDELLGHQHVVIKSLGEAFKGIRGVSGCTILGDGKVGLILDVGGLMDSTLG